jgi:hypothetical protein
MVIAQIASGPALPTGIGLGSVIAVVCSWQRNRSILWAIIAGLLSWVYVVYFAITRRKAAPGASIPQFPLGMRRDQVLWPASKK